MIIMHRMYKFTIYSLLSCVAFLKYLTLNEPAMHWSEIWLGNVWKVNINYILAWFCLKKFLLYFAKACDFFIAPYNIISQLNFYALISVYFLLFLCNRLKSSLDSGEKKCPRKWIINIYGVSWWNKSFNVKSPSSINFIKLSMLCNLYLFLYSPHNHFAFIISVIELEQSI